MGFNKIDCIYQAQHLIYISSQRKIIYLHGLNDIIFIYDAERTKSDPFYFVQSIIGLSY